MTIKLCLRNYFVPLTIIFFYIDMFCFTHCFSFFNHIIVLRSENGRYVYRLRHSFINNYCTPMFLFRAN